MADIFLISIIIFCYHANSFIININILSFMFHCKCNSRRMSWGQKRSNTRDFGRALALLASSFPTKFDPGSLDSLERVTLHIIHIQIVYLLAADDV